MAKHGKIDPKQAVSSPYLLVKSHKSVHRTTYNLSHCEALGKGCFLQLFAEIERHTAYRPNRQICAVIA